MKTIEHNQVFTDNTWQTLNLSGAIVRVDMRAPGVVDVWSEVPEAPEPFASSFRCFETDDAIPNEATYRGSAAWSTTTPMWHLYEKSPEQS